jgi:hypothetical protein
MKYLLWLLYLFIPREDGEGDGDEGGEGGEGDNKPPGGNPPGGRPDWLPEKFWDDDVGVRAEPLAKSFTELEGKLRTKHDDLKNEVIADMKAAAPEEYVFNQPDDLKIPEGVELDMTADDPMVSWFFDFAKEHGMSQETVDSAIKQYMETELAGMPDINAEIEKLGDHGQDRVLRVHNWMSSKLSDEEVSALDPLMTSAASIEALEKLMKSAGPSDFDSENVGDALTLDELKSMQNDPRYYREKDPAFIKKVTDGYDRLYKNA